MNKYDEWIKTCLRKAKLSEAEADSIIHKEKTPLRKYKCPHCTWWHLTSKLTTEKHISKHHH